MLNFFPHRDPYERLNDDADFKTISSGFSYRPVIDFDSSQDLVKTRIINCHNKTTRVGTSWFCSSQAPRLCTMVFRCRNPYYLRISEKNVLPLYVIRFPQIQSVALSDSPRSGIPRRGSCKLDDG